MNTRVTAASQTAMIVVYAEAGDAPPLGNALNGLLVEGILNEEMDARMDALAIGAEAGAAPLHNNLTQPAMIVVSAEAGDAPPLDNAINAAEARQLSQLFSWKPRYAGLLPPLLGRAGKEAIAGADFTTGDVCMQISMSAFSEDGRRITMSTPAYIHKRTARGYVQLRVLVNCHTYITIVGAAGALNIVQQNTHVDHGFINELLGMDKISHSHGVELVKVFKDAVFSKANAQGLLAAWKQWTRPAVGQDGPEATISAISYGTMKQLYRAPMLEVIPRV